MLHLLLESKDLVFGLKNNFFRSWSSACRAAGIKEVRFHDLRATAITFWLVRGMKTEFAMLRSGHTIPKTFLRYVRASEDIRKKEHRQLSQWELADDFASLLKLSEVELPQAGFIN